MTGYWPSAWRYSSISPSNRGSPLMVVRHLDGADAVELHQGTSDGEAIVHVRTRPQAMADMWERFGVVEIQPDGTKVMVIDAGA